MSIDQGKLFKWFCVLDLFSLGEFITCAAVEWRRRKTVPVLDCP